MFEQYQTASRTVSERYWVKRTSLRTGSFGFGREVKSRFFYLKIVWLDPIFYINLEPHPGEGHRLSFSWELFF